MRATLGRYELLVRIAAGGGANVFLARDPKNYSQLVAIKVILPRLVSVPEAVSAFFTEAKIAARLNHPNIVAIAGFGQTDGVYGLAMEYVFGASLADILNTVNRVQKPLTVCTMLKIVSTIAGALHYAHELTDERGAPMGLVHRDISPENVMVGFDGIPKLMDFGIAKVVNRGWQTQNGIVKGKSRYMSPEQLLAKKVDRRSDVFLLGIVLWECLTGRPLFAGKDVTDIFKAIAQREIPKPSEASPGLPNVLDPIVLRALRRVPEQRYQTADEMRLAIEELLDRAKVLIEPATIAKELGELYGDTVETRAAALRRVREREEFDGAALAAALGAEPIHRSQLPTARIHPGNIEIHELLKEAAPSAPERPARDALAADVDAVLRTIEMPAPAFLEDPKDALERLMGIAPEEDAPVPRAPSVMRGWQDQNTTIEDRTAPLLMVGEEERRLARMRRDYMASLQKTPAAPPRKEWTDDAPTYNDIERVTVDDEASSTAAPFAVGAVDRTIASPAPRKRASSEDITPESPTRPDPPSRPRSVRRPRPPARAPVVTAASGVPTESDEPVSSDGDFEPLRVELRSPPRETTAAVVPPDRSVRMSMGVIVGGGFILLTLGFIAGLAVSRLW